ncbi:hypothetical protein BCT23_21840 [Enterovibrio norvegicus]|uniref:LPP20 lipoprotein n=1 Tax=Enterovibrio norvegicus TaxID=188144 RepID=A0A2N7L751_9GAMM|nr:hypothetical protein BCT23_21840 [Enterovibrio norvegicus]
MCKFNWIIRRTITLIFLGLLLVIPLGCQSTQPPQWYTDNNNVKNTKYIYALGEGRSLSAAKIAAISDINSQLWTQVDSSFSMNDVYRKINENSAYHESVNRKVNAKSAQVTFTGVEYVESDKNDFSYYVKARIEREKVKSQLLLGVGEIESVAKSKIENLAHQDKLTWWLDNQGIENKRKDLYVHLAILASLDNDYKYEIKYLPKLVDEISEVKSGLLLLIRQDKKDRKSANFVSEKLSGEGIATTKKLSRRTTHVLDMESEYRRGIVGDAYITTKLTNLIVKDKSGKVLSRNEVISTGNSLTNYYLSQEGAERHFSELLEEAGIWNAFGL